MEPRASLAAVDIRKTYPGVEALRGVTLEFFAGEVHALIGKNGAGKSTLVKIFAGSTQPTSGHVLVAGEKVSLRSPRHAIQQGIATVYQELSLVPELTVGQNICLPDLPTSLAGFVVHWTSAYQRAQQVLDELHIDIDVHAPVRSLGVARMQMVEIAKAMASQPKALLLDEPTSALAEHEADTLFELLQKLVARGVAVIYISHRMRELQRIANRVSVLRDGQLIGTLPIAAAESRTVAEMMFGDVPHDQRTIEPTRCHDEIILEVRKLCRGKKLRDLDLKLRKGEILGIAGVVGSGRTELLRAISGADRIDGGEILVSGVPIARPTVPRMKRVGIGLTPENRKEQGLVLHLSTHVNICLASLNRLSRWGVLQRESQIRLVENSIRDLQIAVSDPQAPVGTLSGGNQQKVVVAKWLNIALKVLLLDEPTRGVDIQAKRQIFEIMWKLSQAGIGCIFVSSEFEELVEVCHRIAVMQQGQIVRYVLASEVTPHQLFQYCTEFEDSDEGT